MKATIEISFKNYATAKKALNSLKQETKFRKRSSSRMKLRGNSLVIDINAEEFPALRATVHSYLRLLNVIFAVLNITGKEG